MSSAWQRSGETMSLESACARYGVTIEQCEEAKLEGRWRSCYGNGYYVVKIQDVIDLKNKLDKEEADRKEKALIEKYGEEEYYRMQREEKEKKEAEARAAKAAEEAKARAAKAAKERAEAKGLISKEILAIMNLKTKLGVTKISSIAGEVVNKTTAKKEWCLSDGDLADLPCTTEGRSKFYNLHDLIAKADSKYALETLTRKLKERNKKHQVAKKLEQFVAYRYEKTMAKLSTKPADLVKEASAETMESLKEDIKAAEQEIVDAQKAVREISSGLSFVEELTATLAAANDENDEPAKPTKKVKIAA